MRSQIKFRIPKRDRPRCGARTRRGTECQRQALRNGRCPNHGGMSTGPCTAAGRARIAAAQRERHARGRRERCMSGFGELLQLWLS
jgi:hypothetical protein